MLVRERSTMRILHCGSIQGARHSATTCSNWFAGLSAVAFLAISTIVTDVSAQGGPTGVGVASAEMVEIVDTRPVIGQLVASVEADVATRTAGIVAEVAFQIGDRVANGQVLVRLDEERLQLERQAVLAEVEVAKAGQKVAEAELKRAEQGFQRQAALSSSGAFSRSRYEDLEQDAARAKGVLLRAAAELSRSEARLAEIDYRLQHSRIVAPFSGVVIGRRAQPGAYMPVGSTIATLMDTSKLEIEADVPVELIGALGPGREVSALFSNSAEMSASTKAHVRALVPVQSVSTRTRAVRFTIDLSNLDRSMLAGGASVTLQIPASAPRRALAIPKDALVQSGTGWMVFIVDDGKAAPRTVVLGQSAAERIEVTSGLNQGDVVVIRGNERLRPGQSIAPNAASSPQSSGRIQKSGRS